MTSEERTQNGEEKPGAYLLYVKRFGGAHILGSHERSRLRKMSILSRGIPLLEQSSDPFTIVWDPVELAGTLRRTEFPQKEGLCSKPLHFLFSQAKVDWVLSGFILISSCKKVAHRG